MGFENAFADINTYNPRVYFSQLDMVLIQLSFFGPMLYPQLHLLQEGVDIDALLHSAAVLGRLLGIEDRFNLGLHYSRDVVVRITKNILSCAIGMDLNLTRMLESYLVGIKGYYGIPLSSRALYYFMLKQFLPELKCQNLYNLLSYRDRLVVAGIDAAFTACYYVSPLNSFARYFTDTWYPRITKAYDNGLKKDMTTLPLLS
jgi:hypothetical protein